MKNSNLNLQNTLDPVAQTPQNLLVFQAEHFRVHSGVNVGDPIAQAREIEISDTYRLEASAKIFPLSITVQDETIMNAPDSLFGTVGATLHLDCVVTLMSPDGATVEAMVVIETNADQCIENTYLLPFSPLQEKRDYIVVAIDQSTPHARLAEATCASFTHNTLITLANGIQKPIQDLNVGDRALTRDNGAREIKWIGTQTLRASGAFAPIIIKKGTLNNENDLVVSPNHRVFIYQRKDRMNAGRAEILIKAKLLVNGTSVIQSDGGFVDYYQLLFDTHEIIYAEGIAVESMFLHPQIKPYLPNDVQARMPSQSQSQSSQNAIELQDDSVESKRAAEMLREASSS